MNLKQSTFAERQAASAAAKQALLEKFKPKPMVTAEEPIDHDAERRERIEALRRKRQEEKEERRRAREEAAAAAETARIEAERAEQEALLAAQQLTDAQKRAERKERKKAIKEAAREKKASRQQAPRASAGRSNDRGEVDPYKEHERYIRSLERARA